jgi:DNA-binding NtrC family response regulator
LTKAEEEVRNHRDHLEELVKARTEELRAARETKMKQTLATQILGNSDAMEKVRKRILAVAATNASVMIVRNRYGQGDGST